MTIPNPVRSGRDDERTVDVSDSLGETLSAPWALLTAAAAASFATVALGTLTGLAFGIPGTGLLLGAVLVAVITLAALMI